MRRARFPAIWWCASRAGDPIRPGRLTGPPAARSQAFFLPFIVGLATESFMLLLELQPDSGAVDAVLGKLGLASASTAWTVHYDLALGVICVFVVWFAPGLTMMILMGGMQGIPGDLYEAANVNGASWWQKERRITIPMLRRNIALSLIISPVGDRAASPVTLGHPVPGRPGYREGRVGKAERTADPRRHQGLVGRPGGLAEQVPEQAVAEIGVDIRAPARPGARRVRTAQPGSRRRDPADAAARTRAGCAGDEGIRRYAWPGRPGSPGWFRPASRGGSWPLDRTGAPRRVRPCRPGGAR